jgi:MinD superfamily P-loop ATPase
MRSIYRIGDGCITCGRCERNCPKQAVYPGPEHYEIDRDKCIGCGRCAMLCPLAVIRKEERA